MTPKDLKRTQINSNDSIKKVKTKNNLKGGANIEINEHYLDGILHKGNV